MHTDDRSPTATRRGVTSLVALLLSGLLIAAIGGDPIATFDHVLRSSFGDWYVLSDTLVKATPLILTGLACALAFRMRLWNIGAEGQFILGAIFGGWVAMTHGDQNLDVMMGDLVLSEREVNPVMSALLENGLDVTALHNHFFFETPRIFYMHVHGMGSAADLATRVKPAIALID